MTLPPNHSPEQSAGWTPEFIGTMQEWRTGRTRVAFLNLCVAATPAGVGSVTSAFRGCRCAQPPANGWHPCGMAGRESGRFGTVSGVRLPANGWRLCGMAGREPGGFGAISRWLSEERATPPENGGIEFCIPEGCPPHLQSLRKQVLKTT